MKKLIAILITAAFAGTAFNAAAQAPATPATPGKSTTQAAPVKAEAKKSGKSEGKKKAKSKSKTEAKGKTETK